MSSPSRIETIFLNALEKGTPAERAAYVDEACAGDAELRRRVERLLRAHPEVTGFLEQPAAALAAAPTPPDSEAPQTADYVRGDNPATIIGPYKLLQQIGEGGMGTVYMAQQTEPVQRKVALKIIKAGMDSAPVIARFEAERQALALMDHPHIAKVLDAGTTKEGRPFFVMELVRGVPITRYCDERRLTLRQRLELFVPVCQAVQHAHQKGIIHRDLKPSNVLVAPYDGKPQPKVIDFGVAKATGIKLTERTLFTEFGQVVGTVEYMSPEQAELNQLDIDTRSDIYALGVLLYELLTGTTPLQRNRLKEAAFIELLRIIREEEPPKPSTRLSTVEELPAIAAQRGLEPKKLSGLLRGELDWIVMKCLEKDRNRRYETANGLAMDVERYLRDESVLACPPSARYRVRKFVRRHRVGLAMAGTVALLLVLGTLISSWQAIRATNAEALATERLTSERAAHDALNAARDEKEQQRTRINRELSEALVEAAGLREKARTARPGDPEPWSQLRATLLRSETLAASELADPGLVERVRVALAELKQDETNRRMAARLEEIRFGKSFGPDAVRTAKETSAAYHGAFLDYGLPILDLAADEAATRISVSGIRDALVAALDDWVSEDWQLERRLLPIALRASNDPWRRQYFDAELRRDLPELLRLGGQPEAGAQPAGMINNLARRLIQLEPTSAVQLLRDAQRQNPADVWLNYSLAEALGARNMRSGGSWEEVISYRRAALAVRPDSPPLHIQLGWALAYGGHGEEAIATFEKSLQLRADDFFPYYGLGFVYRQLGRLDDALAAYQKALLLNADPVHTRLALIGVLEKQGARDEAILNHLVACRQSLRLADLYGNDLAATIADLFAKYGKVDEAIAVLMESVRHEPSYPHNEEKLYDLLKKTGRIEKALADCREETAGKSTAIGTYRLLGVIAGKEERWDEAIDAWRHVVRSKPSSSSWIALGRVLAKAKQTTEAVQAYREALRIDPVLWHLHSPIGQALEQAGRVDEAIEAYWAGIRANPASAEELERLCNLLASTGRLEAALPELRRIIRLQLSNLPSALAHGQRFEGKALDLAIAVYREAIRAKSDDGLLHNALARALQKKGLFDEATTVYQNVFRLRPNDVQLHLSFGQQFEEKGRADLALAVYQQALRNGVDLSPPLRIIASENFNTNAKPVELLLVYRVALACLSSKSGGNYTSLGDALAKLNLLDEAIAAWREGVRLQPTSYYGQQQLGLGLEKKGLVAEALAAYQEALRAGPDLPPVLQRLLNGQFARSAKPDELLPVYRVALSCHFYKSGGNYGSLADALAKLNLLDEAIAAWRESIRLEPNYPLYRQKLAAGLEKKGLEEEAAAAWREVIRLEPKHVAAYAQLAGLLCKVGKLDEAISLKSDYPWALQICDLLQSKGLLGAGISACREGIRQRPNEVSFHIVLGLALERQLQWEPALAAYSEWVRLQPKNGEALVRRALLHRRLGNADEALADLNRTVEAAPGESSAWIARAQFHVSQRHWTEAAADFSRSVELNAKDTASRFGRADAYTQLKQWDKAAADYTELTLLVPTNATAWLRRGEAFNRLGQLDKSVSDSSRAIELSPTLRAAWINRAVALRRLGQWDKARADYSEAIKLDAKDPSAWSQRSQCLFNLGRFREAVADLEESIRLNPNAASFHNALAWLLATCPNAELRDARRAVEAARKAVELAPQAGIFWNTLGAAHYRAGDWNAAVTALGKSMELRKDGDAFDWFFLSMAHGKLGHREEARKFFERAVHWLEQNKETLEKDPQHAEELRHFRREAEEVLDLKKG